MFVSQGRSATALCFSLIAVASSLSSSLASVDDPAQQHLGDADCVGTPTSSNVDVVIVGAGMAGLKAAQTIEQLASEEVSYVLVEGQNRVGGRMKKHDDFSNHTVEDGANWIEGVKGNPIYNLALKYGLKLYPQNFLDWSTYLSDGTPVDPTAVADRLQDYQDAFKCLEKKGLEAWTEHDCEGVTLQDPGARAALTDCGWTPMDAVDDTIDWSYIDFEFAMRPSRTSVYSFPEDTFTDFDERRYLVKDERGFEHIASEFAKHELDQDPIVDTEVYHIEWNNAESDVPARVSIINRTNKLCHVFETKKILSTVSAGVLENRKDLFDPPLNQDEDASPYKMAVYQKVFFNFTEKFWEDDHDFINIAMTNRTERGMCSFWQTLDKGDATSNVDGADLLAAEDIAIDVLETLDGETVTRERNGGGLRKLKKEKDNKKRKKDGESSLAFADSEMAADVSDDIFPGSRTLFCTITTEACEKLGGVTEENAVQFLEPLKAIYGEDKVQHDSIYIPEWESDPWTYGSYANWKVGKGPDSFYDYYSPRMDSTGRKVIHLGGSASCLRYWEFVHGAYYSGEMKALEILADLGVDGVDNEWEEWDHICMQ